MGFVGLLDGTGLPVGAPASKIEITGVVVEALVATPTAGASIAGVVVEALVATPAGIGVAGVVVEALVADDIESTQITGVVVEALVALNSSALSVSGVVLEALVGLLREPEDLVVSRYTDITEQRIGRDLVLPGLGGTDPAPPTLTGDWPSISGRDNLHAAVRRRLVTAPGQLVHRPEYGGGLPLYVGRLATPGEAARLAAGARQNLLRDPRIAQADVRAGEPPGMPSAVLVEVAVQPTGEPTSDTVAVVTEG